MQKLTRDVGRDGSRSAWVLTFALMGLWLPWAGGFACEEELFSARHRDTEKILVRWEPVSNVIATCNQERGKRGKPPYGPAILGCSFWDYEPGDGLCRIYTSLDTSIETLGHELRHCFQGNYHD
ncbi:MAG: hypothetical protein RLZZ09_2791 [Pseudomonadota bacterium]|jgi:hypothetical protein